jgi:hypothetical protein
MVHALREARRVLKPDGILIDLRPAIEHSRVGLLRAGRFRELGRTCERFDGGRAANRAVSHVLARRLFRRSLRVRLECDVVFASPGALREWLAEYTDLTGSPAHEKLVQQAKLASRGGQATSRIVYRIPLVMRVLGRERPNRSHATPRSL